MLGLDDAQNYPSTALEELRMLLGLGGRARSAFALILLGAYLNWHISRAGLDREIFAPAAIDLLAEASEGNPRALSLLAQAA